MTQHYEAGLVARLTAKHKDLDVAAVAAEIERDPAIRNPSGALIARVNKLAAQSTPPPRSATVGAFTPDGAWWPEAQQPNKLTEFVWWLCRERRSNSAMTPRRVAELAAQREFHAAFGTAAIESWATLDSDESWTIAFAGTCVSECVKRCGRGHCGVWQGGVWSMGSGGIA